MVSSYFITGTGRCGTLLLPKLLNCSEYTQCNHEYSINTEKLKRSFYKNRLKVLIKDIDRLLAPTIRKWNGSGKSYGECSGHLYPIFPELYRRYEHTSRFILLVRNPVNFVRSALARGFFSPDHPNALEHVVPPKDTAMGSIWHEATPLEKCAWYWAMVNGMVYRFFLSVPNSLYKILPIESVSIEIVEELYNFLCLKDFDSAKPAIEKLLLERYNASPGQGDERHLNPFSTEIRLGKKETWTAEQIAVFEKHVIPMEKIIYGEEESKLSDIKNLSSL